MVSNWQMMPHKDNRVAESAVLWSLQERHRWLLDALAGPSGELRTPPHIGELAEHLPGTIR
jgi:hypothetical protein